MNACPSLDVIQQLLDTGQPEDDLGTLQEHLNGCKRCQEVLNRLTDDPELRRQAAACWPTPLPYPEPAPPPIHVDAESPDSLLQFLAPPDHEGDLGTLGPYRILKELGRGGMGIVLLAHDKRLTRTVALKVLRPDRSDKAARTRFVREARAAARIAHDNVVPVYAVANPAEGLPYLVMQYVEGPTLRDRIEAGPALTPRAAARIGRQVALGLAAAHKQGLIHRDIKPANIILDRATGRARIMDFGLVRSTAPSDGLTEVGTIPGTPEYMSPEQVRAADAIDSRSDVYSLGVTLYEALTGEAPFRGVPHMVLQQVLHEEPRAPRRLNDRIPRDLETICLKAMARDRGQRYQTAREMADDLQRWLNSEPIRARPVGIPGKLWRWCRREPALAALTVAIGLLVIASLIGSTWLWRRAENNYALALDREREVNRQRGIADEQRSKAGTRAVEAEREKRLRESRDQREMERGFRLFLDRRSAAVPPRPEEGTRQLFMENALVPWLEQVSEEQRLYPGQKLESAQTLLMLGRMLEESGMKPQAELRYDQAMKLFHEEIERILRGPSPH